MGLDKDEYPVFKVLNRDVIKPAIQEINALTNFFIEIEPKRIGRKIGELKFRISRLKELPTVQSTQETFSFDIDDLPSIAIETGPSGSFTERGTPDCDPRMGCGGRYGSPRGERRFCCVC